MFKAINIEKSAWLHKRTKVVYGIAFLRIAHDPWRGYFALIGVIPDDGKRHHLKYYCEDSFFDEFEIYGEFSRTIELAI